MCHFPYRDAIHKTISPSFCSIGTCICHIILVKIMGVYHSSLCTYPLTCVSLTEALLFYSFINLNINILFLSKSVVRYLFFIFAYVDLSYLLLLSLILLSQVA